MDNVDKVINALKPVADKLGQGAKALFEIYTRQMFAEGIAQLVLAVVFLTVSIVVFTKVVPKMYKGYQEAVKDSGRYSRDEEMPYGFIAWMSGIASVALIVASLSLLYSGVLKTINPQYYAIERLTCQVTKCSPSN